jgi:hypothetical protein
MHAFPDDRNSTQGEIPEQKVRALFEWSGVPEKQWRKVITNKEATDNISRVLDQIVALPQVQRPSAVPLTVGRHVINVRPLVIPALVAAVVNIAVAVSPNLESPILPWLDLVAVLERLNHIYKSLDDDEVDVFGAVAGLSRSSDLSPSVTNPASFPSVEGIQTWFRNQGYQAPNNLELIVRSLKEKGAIQEHEGLYHPSFLGKGE